MFAALKARFHAFCRRVGPERQTILAVSRNPWVFRELRVLAIEQGWSIRFATSLPQAQFERPHSGICVLIYDLENWRPALPLLAHSDTPLIPIVLSGNALRAEVIAAGGYDLALKPLDRAEVARLIHQAIALAAAIDSCASILPGHAAEYSNSGIGSHRLHL